MKKFVLSLLVLGFSFLGFSSASTVTLSDQTANPYPINLGQQFNYTCSSSDPIMLYADCGGESSYFQFTCNDLQETSTICEAGYSALTIANNEEGISYNFDVSPISSKGVSVVDGQVSLTDKGKSTIMTGVTGVWSSVLNFFIDLRPAYLIVAGIMMIIVLVKKAGKLKGLSNIKQYQPKWINRNSRKQDLRDMQNYGRTFPRDTENEDDDNEQFLTDEYNSRMAQEDRDFQKMRKKYKGKEYKMFLP